MTKKRIAILCHKEDNEHTLQSHLILPLAEYWREDGHEVIFLFGTDQFIPADLLFVHVDLSVVPDDYLSFARQYPVMINGNIRDVRKSVYSPGLLKKGDDWDGSVIVKSEKNSAGIPERGRTGFYGKIQDKILKAANRLNGRASPLTIRTALDYKVYDHLEGVPSLYFHHPGLVIQKFIPEIDDGFYCVRIVYFLGDHMSCMRLKSRNPIVKDETVEEFERDIVPHPDILGMRKRMQFDYGKFDYVVVDGEAILIDANKTVGWPPNVAERAETKKRLRHHSKGLYAFFED